MTGAALRLNLGRMNADRPALASRWEVLLGVVADFSVTIGPRTFVAEEMFPVVELASSLRGWLHSLDGGKATGFSYESMESAERPLLGFIPHEGGWRASSALQEHEETRVFTTEEVRCAAARFIDDVRREAATQLAVDVDPLLRSL